MEKGIGQMGGVANTPEHLRGKCGRLLGGMVHGLRMVGLVVGVLAVRLV